MKLALALLCAIVPLSGAISVTNSTGCFSTPSGSSTTETCTTDFSPTNGRSLFVWAYHSNGSTISVTDGEGTGNTYTASAVDSINGTDIRGILFRATNVSGSGAYTLTITSGTAAFAAAVVWEVSFTGTLSVDGTPATGTGSGANPAGGNTTVAANSIVFAMFGHNTGASATLTQPTGYTTIESTGDGTSAFVGGAAYKVSAGATESSTWTYANTTDWAAGVIGYAESGGGGSPTRRRVVIVQ